MKIGIVVDGVSEFASLGELYQALTSLSGNQFMTPARADIQPLAPTGVIVRQCQARVSQFVARGAGLVVVLLDREDRPEPPCQLASAIRQGLIARVGAQGIGVVVKDRAYENWVIADIDGVRACSARFQVSNASANAVQPNKADTVDAITLLKRAARGGAYDKVKDSKAILKNADPTRIGLHSRSFRRFMRVTNCTPYQDQSRRP